MISANAGNQKETGFPGIKYGAGLVRPGMTPSRKFMPSCIKSPSSHSTVEVDVPVVDQDVERGAQSIYVWALGGLFVVDGLDGDALDRLKLAGKQVA